MMSSTNEEDPFLQVQQDVLSALQQARPLFASYLRIRSLASSSSNSKKPSSSGPSSSTSSGAAAAGGGPSPELVSARADLEAALSSLAEDLEDLLASVRAVESDPARYGVTAAELRRRQRLVQEVGGEVEDMGDELAKMSSSSSTSTQNKNNARMARQAASRDLPDPSSFALGGGGGGDDDDGGDEDDEDYAAEFEHQQQLHMMREQDEQLDGVFATVGNLRRQADDMGRELEEQREMLEVVDNLADRVGGRLQTGMQKMAYVVRKNEDRWSGCCIAVLIMVLIILLVLLLVL